jgi:hypothetical protein
MLSQSQSKGPKARAGEERWGEGKQFNWMVQTKLNL